MARKRKVPVMVQPAPDLGFIDGDGDWHAFPPLPEWDPTPIKEGDKVKVGRFTRRAVRDPLALFRHVLPELAPGVAVDPVVGDVN